MSTACINLSLNLIDRSFAYSVNSVWIDVPTSQALKAELGAIKRYTMPPSAAKDFEKVYVGPVTEPCGIPHLTCNLDYSIILITVNCFRSVR